MVAPQVDPQVLGGDGYATEHEAQNDDGSHGDPARRPPANAVLDRQPHVGGRTSQGSSEIDEHVYAEKQEPDHRRRAVETSSDLQLVPVEEPHRDPAAKQHDSRHHEDRSE
jgi:hypothetical protein